MLKLIIFFCSIILTSENFVCQKKNSAIERSGTDTLYKGRLEIKGICMNYTIKILEGDLDSDLYQQTWKDEHSGKIHTNVFALGSPCNFPSRLNEGDEFYFVIEQDKKTECAVCMAYYPIPEKKLKIKVIKNASD